MKFYTHNKIIIFTTLAQETIFDDTIDNRQKCKCKLFGKAPR